MAKRRELDWVRIFEEIIDSNEKNGANLSIGKITTIESVGKGYYNVQMSVELFNGNIPDSVMNIKDTIVSKEPVRSEALSHLFKEIIIRFFMDGAILQINQITQTRELQQNEVEKNNSTDKGKKKPT